MNMAYLEYYWLWHCQFIIVVIANWIEWIGNMSNGRKDMAKIWRVPIEFATGLICDRAKITSTNRGDDSYKILKKSAIVVKTNLYDENYWKRIANWAKSVNVCLVKIPRYCG
jgi:hypothetical protein